MSLRRRWRSAALGLALVTIISTTAALVSPSLARADYDASGVTTHWPWSGYWWPMLDTYANLYDDNGPLQKYDTYLKNTTGTAGGAQAYEKAHYSTSDAANEWWGHCHAWSAASILTGEPPNGKTIGGVNFSSDDLRGLVTDLYYSPKYSWLAGTRSDSDDKSTDAYKDIAPAWMDYLLRYYVGYYRYPFIMDINADSQVWNFPAFAYTRTVTANADGSQAVSTRVWYASPDYGVTGTKYFTRDYTYTLKDGTLGQWTGSSVDNHPDFAWLPTGRNEVPHLDASVVAKIVGENV